MFPALRFLGKNALSAGVNVASDVLKSDDFSRENIKEVGKKRLRSQAKSMASDILEKVSNFQDGSGIKRERRKRRYRKKKTVKQTKKINTIKGVTKKRRKRKIRKNRKTSIKDIFG